ncbi:MAG: exodeoxyribonuclease VII small subunit [Clostridia bacterium]|nr:exodeoxyribonuclease VII small subunit [Clostridia bacterium]
MKQKNYEQAMARIEKIVNILEESELTIDESMKLYEEGVKLTAFCNKYLDTAEQKIIKLSALESDGDGSDE